MKKIILLSYFLFSLIVILPFFTCKTVKPVTKKDEEAEEIVSEMAAPFKLGSKGELLASGAGSASWFTIDSPLFKKVIYPFDGTSRLIFNSLYYNEDNPDHVVVTTSTQVLYSTDRGVTWNSMPLENGINRADYITSAVILGNDPAQMAVATSFSGFYVTRDGGKNWKRISKPLLIYRGAGFFEEIASILPVKGQTDQLYLLYAYGKGLVKIDLNANTSTSLPIPQSSAYPRKIFYKNQNLTVSTKNSAWFYNGEDKSWKKADHDPSGFSKKADPVGRKGLARDKKGIFLTAYQASNEAVLKKHMKFLKEYKLNSIVIDMKDDRGKLTYDTNLELPAKLTKKQGPLELEKLLEICHNEGIYIIGRIVVFKDQALYFHDDYRYTLKDIKTGKPWGNLIRVEDESTDQVSYVQREFWVDPFCPQVWDYNTAIAKELQDRGVDEIQFDYIRFPSDGDTSRISSVYRKEGMRSIDALESFLARVRKDITIPISTDLYGFNSFYRMGNWIGQNMEMVSRYVDVICPMFYPSHFPYDFMRSKNYIERAGQIYEEGTMRAREIVQGRSIIRPYVQAFLLPSEFYMSEEQYHTYLINQVQGTYKAKGSGFTLWNMSNTYYMASPELKNYIPDN